MKRELRLVEDALPLALVVDPLLEPAAGAADEPRVVSVDGDEDGVLSPSRRGGGESGEGGRGQKGADEAEEAASGLLPSC
ncbi:hypothetical protein [Hyalangium rubrum]|uniref:Uncharacterized protein n=1 Tax=Hyalangium rubrum TaxID=3103134 RepID=A0ABU5HHJ3_9BACT|nr:hypothetical protein [Hyalangium sp. s54d21]MDY7232826.1 hypothetical protein [Hyalangium sp. s54d21]